MGFVMISAVNRHRHLAQNLLMTDSQNVGGFTKRQITSAATFIAYCVSAINYLYIVLKLTRLSLGWSKIPGTLLLVLANVDSKNIAGPHTVLDPEEAMGFPTATKAMLAG